MAIVGGVVVQALARHWRVAVWAGLAVGLGLQTWRVDSLKRDAVRLADALAVEEQRGDAIERLAEEQALAVREWRTAAEAASAKAKQAARQAAQVMDAERQRVDSLGVDAEAMRAWWGRL